MASAKKSAQEISAERSAQKVAAFKKLATARTSRALDAIVKLIPLTNTKAYTYDNGQRDKILAALKSAVAKVEAGFASPAAAKSNDFTV